MPKKVEVKACYHVELFIIYHVGNYVCITFKDLKKEDRFLKCGNEKRFLI